MRMRIGLLVNPVAGMGGSVGLKGTDGLVEEALKLGARPIACYRARSCMEELVRVDVDAEMEIITCGGDMGEKVLTELRDEHAHRVDYRVVYTPQEGGTTTGTGTVTWTTREDTKRACEIFMVDGIDLLLFCGGDGTARDIFGVVGREVPILGIPAGVKMHSAVFAITPRCAARIVKQFCEGGTELRDVEIMDTDEEAYRRNELRIKVFGYARAPYVPSLIQQGKSLFQSVSEDRAKEEIARFACEFMGPDELYIMGAGTTIHKIAEMQHMGADKTLLGVDAVRGGKVVGKDLNERELLRLIASSRDRGERIRIMVSPIGAQGFIFGRGNQQISAAVIKEVGIENVIVVATPQKLSETPFLLVDTGDEELDKKLCGYITVVCGYRMAQRKEVRRG